jgi:molybdate transport system substrate-binding protein
MLSKRRWKIHPITILILALFSSIALAPSSGAAPQRGQTVVMVFAAASLSDAFTEIGHRIGREQPGLTVRFNFAGSQQLASQIEHGAAADVFAPADETWMPYLAERSLLAGKASLFARNRLVVIVPKSNPGRIHRLQDLARPGIKLVLGAAAVPVGKYSREVLQNLARTPGFGADYARRVLANVVSEEENVKSVVGKVQLGEADAGFIYRSDVTPSVARFVRTLMIPERANVLARYPIAVLKNAKHPKAARALVGWVLSRPGQQVLERHGLMPALSNLR